MSCCTALVLPYRTVQFPRLYNVYKETGVIENFQQMLDNIFAPLFEVTADPSTHPQLHVLLSQVRLPHMHVPVCMRVRACVCGRCRWVPGY